MAKRLELVDCRSIVMAIIDRRIGRVISLNEGGVAEEGLLGRLLGAMGGSGCRWGRRLRGRRWRRGPGAHQIRAAVSGARRGKGWQQRRTCTERSDNNS